MSNIFRNLFQIWSKFFLLLTLLSGTNLLIGCVSMQPKLEPSHISATARMWQGVMSVRVEDSSSGEKENTRVSAFSSAFVLQGNSAAGNLQFDGPFGVTLARIHWSPSHAAVLQIGAGENSKHHFSNLSELLKQATGADLPVDALFDWLDGYPTSAPGWMVDLDNLGKDGIIIAKRIYPLPVIHLRIALQNRDN